MTYRSRWLHEGIIEAGLFYLRSSWYFIHHLSLRTRPPPSIFPSRLRLSQIANASASYNATKPTTTTLTEFSTARLLSSEQNQLLPATTHPEVKVYMMSVQEQYWTLAMSLWTHCGFGVSGRLAERHLVLLERESGKHRKEGGIEIVGEEICCQSEDGASYERDRKSPQRSHPD